MSPLWESRCAPALSHNGSAGWGNVWKQHLLCFSWRRYLALESSQLELIPTCFQPAYHQEQAGSLLPPRVLASRLQKGYQGHGECDTIHIISTAHWCCCMPWSRGGERRASLRNQRTSGGIRCGQRILETSSCKCVGHQRSRGSE